MIDKQIINGVDVSECCWCNSEPDTEPYCRINDGEDLNCEENPNCYFKQLKRKEQECEKLKQECKALREKRAYADMACEQLEKQINKYLQALVETKDYCNKYPQNSIGFKKIFYEK